MKGYLMVRISRTPELQFNHMKKSPSADILSIEKNRVTELTIYRISFRLNPCRT